MTIIKYQHFKNKYDSKKNLNRISLVENPDCNENATGCY